MSGKAEAVGAGVTLEWQGKTYKIDSFGLEDWGLLENILLRKKRTEMMERVAGLYEILPLDVWERKYKEAEDKANRFA